MRTISEYKDLAVEALTGKWGSAAIATIIYMVIFGCVTSFVYTSIVSIFLLPLVWGYAVYFLATFRGEQQDLGVLFSGFQNGNYWKFVGTLLLKLIYVSLWSLLLLIPGIVKSYSYSMTEFLMKDNPDLKYDEAITASSQLMQGHKMQLFLLDLSMIGWVILSCLTLGIGLLFLTPYNQTAHAAFYEDLAASQGQDVEGLIQENSDFEEVE